jgi:uncharacterized repeat protein (TIGR03803 family)
MIASHAACIAIACAAFAAAAAVASAANAGTMKILYAFRGFPAGDGANPQAVPVMDDKGNLYGTASAGGRGGCGMVYRLHKTRSGTWKETTLYNFACGNDGNGPLGGLVFDNKGNLYGGTELGGTGQCNFFGVVGCGVVYELSPTKSGPWTETVLYSFPAPSQGSQFAGPLASFTFDGKDQFFGTTALDDACGGNNYGSVFRLKRSNGSWNEQDIHDFCGSDGSAPGYGALALDPAGNLYGTTMFGGADSDGVVFELSPVGRGKWALSKLHEFTSEEGGELEGGVTLDASGNLFGTEFAGGLAAHGAVYELSPSGGAWILNVLYEFTGGGSDGTGPWANPVFDSTGNLFGTTQAGGEAAFGDNCGVIYQLLPQGGGKWSESVVYTFCSEPNIADGSDPIGGLIRAPDGKFYGTTYAGGDSSCNCGVVFEFTP